MLLPDRTSESDHLVSNTHLPPRLLASGVDALYLSGNGDLDPELLDELARRRCEAEQGSVATVELGSLSFTIAGHGFGKYRYSLDHPIGRVGCSPSGHLPPLRIQPRSEFLHGIGPTGTVAVFGDVLAPFCHGLRLAVSRIDLYADIAGFPLVVSDHERYVCRADSRRVYEDAGRCTGFDFGKRGSRSLHGRVYDKFVDVVRTGHDWWFDIWRDDLSGEFDLSDGVTRVELEFPRQVLTQFDLDTPHQVLGATAALWRYGTTDWLSLRIPTADTNRSRWPLDPVWAVVQDAPFGGEVAGLDRIRSGTRQGSLRRLTPGLVGYLAAFGALMDATTVTDTLAALEGHLHDDEIARQTPFPERIERRRLAGRTP